MNALTHTRDAWDRFGEWMGVVQDIDGAIRLLDWDRETTMPERGADARGAQVATLHALRHRELVAPHVADLLAELAAADDGSSPDRTAMIAQAERLHGRASRLSEDLVREVSEATNQAVTVWLATRDEGDFTTFAPALERVVRAARESGAAVEIGDEAYDGLLDEFEPGMTSARLETLFADLVPELTRIVGDVPDTPATDPFAGREWPRHVQRALADHVAAAVGFDFTAGLIAESAHPFTSSGHLGDVRFSTRIHDGDPTQNILVTMHETGHGLYSQGHPAELHRTFLYESPSLGAEESQARFLENHVGRHRAFWEHIHPVLVERFGASMDGIGPDVMHRHVTRVSRGWCRVDADEVTYDLHIALRLRLELALIRGTMDVADLPEAWREGMRELLGVTPRHHGEGCMQDIHWAWGLFGYFPTYTLGNMYAAQLNRAYTRDEGDIGDALRRGDVGAPMRFMRERIHRHGRRLPTHELMRRATGEEFSPEPLLERIRGLAAARS